MKVLLVSNIFFGYDRAIARGFHEAGVEALSLNYRPDPGDRTANAVFNLASPRRRALAAMVRARQVTVEARIRAALREYSPDMVVVVKGTGREGRLLEGFRGPVVVWLMDSLLRNPHLLELARGATHFFTFEPGEIAELRDMGIGARFLPLAYAPEWYHPTGAPERLDAVFVGAGYPERLPLLDELAQFAEGAGRRIRVYSQVHSRMNPFARKRLAREFPHLSKVLTDLHLGAMGHDDINRLYNESRVCVNIHHPQSRQGNNMRTYEICGSGGLELLEERNVARSRLLAGREVETYGSVGELLAKFDYYASHDEERAAVAGAGHACVLREHTFAARAAELLSEVNAA